MSTFKKKLKSDGTYHAPGKGDQWGLQGYSDVQIAEWANDPSCIDRDVCTAEISRREQARAERAEADQKEKLEEEARLSARRAALVSNPFDPRKEISADARHIAGRVVTALWVIFVLIPFVLAILFEVLK